MTFGPLRSAARARGFVLTVVLVTLGACVHAPPRSPDSHATRRNVILFVADGLRRGSVNATDTPALLEVRRRGVDFENSHSLFPTFTTPNAAAIATGHLIGDTGDFSNYLYPGFASFAAGRLSGQPTGTLTPFLELDPVLAELNDHFADGNFLGEASLLALARAHGYRTAAVGKLGPVALQDLTQLRTPPPGTGAPQTVFLDDATGVPGSGIALPADFEAALRAAGLPRRTPARRQHPGDAQHPGTLQANLEQQNYFADATTKVILPAFVAAGEPFALVYWSRDPDGTQHSQGDSLNRLDPGINGPTSRAGVRNADANLRQILDWLDARPDVAANTDLVVTSDHGFATLSRHEIDADGRVSQAWSTRFTYLREDHDPARPDVVPGFLPPGFLAIDLAHALSLPLYDPDVALAGDTPHYLPVDPAQPNSARSHQRPLWGNGVLGGRGEATPASEARLIVAANGGSDLIYLPKHDPALLRQIVAVLARADYVGGLFVDSSYGAVPGALPLRAIGLEGRARLPRPALVVAFRSFARDRDDPLQSAVIVADTTMQEGQGTHGSFSRDNTLNAMAAFGPDFRQGVVDPAPVGNADLMPTLAHVLGIELPRRGALAGRVLTEALRAGPAPVHFERRVERARAPAAGGGITILQLQTVAGHRYLDSACFEGSARPLPAAAATVGCTSN